MAKKISNSNGLLQKNPVLILVLAVVIIALAAFILLPAPVQQPPVVAPPQPACGDAKCNGNETCSSCPSDCGKCAPASGDLIAVALPEVVCNMTDGMAQFNALETGNINYCKCVQDNDTRASCERSLRDISFYAQGVAGYSLDTCNKISNPYAKESCASIVNSAIETIGAEDPLYLAFAMTSARNYEEAIPLLEKLVEKDPNDYAVMVVLAQLYSNNAWSEGNTSVQLGIAMEYVDRAIAANPESAVAYRIKGYIYEVRGEPDLAIEAYNKSLEILPDYILSYVGLGHAYRMKGDYRNGIENLQKAKELDPDRKMLSIYSHLCTMESMVQELVADAIEDCQIAINSSDELADTEKASAYLALGHLYLQAGRYEEAKDDFQSALTYTPDEPAIHVYMAELYNKMGRYTYAQQSAETAIGMEPTKAAAYLELSKALFLQGYPVQAASQALEGISMADKDPSLISIAKPITVGKLYYILVDIYTDAGDTANADKYLRLAEAENAKVAEIVASGAQ